MQADANPSSNSATYRRQCTQEHATYLSSEATQKKHQGQGRSQAAQGRCYQICGMHNCACATTAACFECQGDNTEIINLLGNVANGASQTGEPQFRRWVHPQKKASSRRHHQSQRRPQQPLHKQMLAISRWNGVNCDNRSCQRPQQASITHSVATKTLAMAYTSVAPDAHYRGTPGYLHIVAAVVDPTQRDAECECAVHMRQLHPKRAGRKLLLPEVKKHLASLRRHEKTIGHGLGVSMIWHWTHCELQLLEVTHHKSGCTPSATTHSPE